MAFINFLLITFLIVSVIRWAAPYILRWWLQRFMKKHVRNGQFGQFHQFGGSFGAQGQAPRPDKKEGGVKIDYVPKNHGKSELDGGEYVDFEEVK